MRLRRLIQSALFAGLLAICAWISIPFVGMPLTLQTFGVFFALGMLGGKYGTIAIAIYLLMGAVGLPVFSGFQGGLGVLLGPTGGYLIGFLATGIVYRFITRRLTRSPNTRLFGMVLGLLCCYLVGTLWFIGLGVGKGVSYSIFSIILYQVCPFLLPDGIKLMVAIYATKHLRRFVY